MIKNERELLTWILLVVIAVTVVFAASSLGGQADKKTAQTKDTVVPEATSTTTTAVVTFSSPGKLSGAIFTTTPDGGIVNENVHYSDKREVYLDGGPPPNAPVTSAGLPAGLYVFQVTDPSGKVLLSEDPSKCRIVNISSDGVIIGLIAPSTLGLGLEDNYTMSEKAQGAQGKGPKNQGTVYPCHIADPPTPPTIATSDDYGPSGTHDTNTDVDHWSDYSAIVVQLMPFYDTPNPGGVYKAWLTPISDYRSYGGDLNETPVEQKVKGKKVGYERDPGFGTPNRYVKTDNFKVKKGKPKPSPMLYVKKFEDVNGNGEWDPEEPQIGVDECVNETTGALISCPGGWPVEITDPEALGDVYYTPVELLAEPSGTWTVADGLLPGWTQSESYVDNVNQSNANPVYVNVLGNYYEEHTVVFGNYRPANISGMKFIDLNGNGQKDVGEGCDSTDTVNYPGCYDVTVHLDGTDGKGNTVNETMQTDEDGYYEFTGIAPGSYTITVDEEPEFYCSFPGDCQYAVDVESGDTYTDMDFGDLSYAEIHLIKYDDLDGDGVKDPGEPGVAGVNFTLSGLDGMGHSVEITNETNESGMLSFLDLWPGNYTLEEVVPDDRKPSTPAMMRFDLTSDNVSDVEFGNYIPAEKHGMKFIDMNGNGEYDGGDKDCSDIAESDPNKAACSGVEVHLDGKDGKGYEVHEMTTTDENGSYSFTGLNPGKYNVTLVEDGFFCSYPPDCRHEIDLQSGDNETGNNFGDFLPVNISAYKFFDFDHDGVKDENEEYMPGITICLNDSDGIVTENAYHQLIDGCKETDSNGLVEWNYMAPGTYTIYLNESIPGMCGSTSTVQTVTVLSGEVNVSWFGNYGPCNGLTPGYWLNWDVGNPPHNHYTEEQFLDLLDGTIADGNISLAEYYLDPTPDDLGDLPGDIRGCSEVEGALHCMRRFLLADQLTLNLALYPEYPQGGGSLFDQCLIEGKEYLGTLGDAIEEALEIHDADGYGYTREEILAMKNILAGFAEQKNQTSCPVS